jgi:hypothetical protein
LSLGWLSEPSSEGAGGAAGSASTNLGGMLGFTTDDRSGSMGRFLGELLEFDGLASEVRGFAPEFYLQFRDFGTRFLECPLPFTGIAKRRFELRSELPSLLPKGLDFSGQCSRPFLATAVS